MKTIILCGGQGTRLKGYLSTSKPLVEIGDRPILWHIMEYYTSFGYRDFVLCLGYKSEDIVSYFGGHEYVEAFREKGSVTWATDKWTVELVFTGTDENTGGRIKRIEQYIHDDNFFVTYADGLGDVDLTKLLECHINKKKIATITVVNPTLQYGLLEIGDNGEVLHFTEKPKLDKWISSGYFVFNKGIFEYLHKNDVLEVDTLGPLAARREIAAFKHGGFWMGMDTYKEYLELCSMWDEQRAPWRTDRVK